MLSMLLTSSTDNGFEVIATSQYRVYANRYMNVKLSTNRSDLNSFGKSVKCKILLKELIFFVILESSSSLKLVI